ncbi:MAG: diguanylate cyclase [Thermodesulfobacteriota bacterium]|nr:diguanylate cyclase [Thermodesulfobacteriota bacterium]
MNVDILIVDDDSSVRNPMSEFVRLSGYNSFEASSAEEAIDILKTNTIQVVITDIMLPEMSGFELTELIIKEYDSDVIIITGYSDIYSYEEAIKAGASDFIIKPVRFEELLLRLQKVLSERELAKDRVRMMEKLQKLAITDGLTKLHNSRSFYSQLEVEVDRNNRYKRSLALMLMDIDHFKKYNDTYGHLEGDKALVKIAQTIKSCLRKLDSAYRYGGEEFTVILPETSCEEAHTVAQRIKSALNAENFTPQEAKEGNITISIGVTEYYPGEQLSEFIQRADKAMYKSKEKGRNKVTTLTAEELL